MSTNRYRRVGDLAIARVIEMTFPTPAREFFPGTRDEDWAPHREWLAAEGAYDLVTGNILLPVQSYVVRTSRHTILVDTCIGNDKQRTHRPAWHMKSDTTYMDNLRAVGLTCEDIDVVMCTHLHLDHVGWNTRLADGRWVPTFPNATYLMSGKELEAFRWVDQPVSFPSMVDSVLPVVDAGQACLVESDHVIDDEVRLEPTPGHTPDHFAVRLASKGEHAVIAGDLMHSPVQCRHPEWHARPDWDPELASATRIEFMRSHARSGTFVCMMHFPLPSAGRFVPSGDVFRFEYDAERKGGDWRARQEFWWSRWDFHPASTPVPQAASPHSRLTALFVATVADPGKCYDLHGLYLRVDARGRRYWAQRFTAGGRRRTIGLGRYPRVSLRAARAAALANRRTVHAGGDPFEVRRRAPIPTFAGAARSVHALWLPQWSHSRIASAWICSLELHVFSALCDRPISELAVSDVLDVLAQIWSDRPALARGIRQRIVRVMLWAVG